MERTALEREPSIGDLRRLVVTVPQAASVLDLSVKQVRKAIDRRIVTATYVRRGNRRIRALDGIDVLCLRMSDWLKGGVRDSLYVEVKHAPDRELFTRLLAKPGNGKGSRFSKVPPALVQSAVAETLADIRSLQDFTQLVDDEGRLEGTGVEAHRIAALLAGGMSVEEILKDYPNLDRDHIEAAAKYALAVPKAGPPFPSRTAKSVMREGGGGGLAAAFDAARQDEAEDDGE